MSLLTFSIWYTSLACLLITGLVIYGARAALIAADWERRRVRQGVALISGVLLGWLAVAFVLGWQGAYTARADNWPTIQFGIGVPIIGGILLYWRSSLLRDIVEAIPQPWLIGIQTYRALGVIFLILFAAGHIPGYFALPAGIGDIGVGIAALTIAWTYGSSAPLAGLTILWNVVGLADLVVAVGTGFTSSPSPLQITAFDLPNQIITEMPLILVPTFAVPLSVLLHFASLRKSLEARTAGSSTAAAA